MQFLFFNTINFFWLLITSPVLESPESDIKTDICLSLVRFLTHVLIILNRTSCILFAFYIFISLYVASKFLTSQTLILIVFFMKTQSSTKIVALVFSVNLTTRRITFMIKLSFQSNHQILFL